MRRSSWTPTTIALEIQTRCDIQGAGVPEHIQDFVANYTGPARQLAFRLV
jgi:hypothetical protein